MPTKIDLPRMTRGDHSPAHVFTLTRAGLDLTLPGTAIRFMARRQKASALLFTKTIGDGITVDSATQFTLALVPADTSGLPDNAQHADTLEYEIEVTEDDGHIETPIVGTWPVRHDFG